MLNKGKWSLFVITQHTRVPALTKNDFQIDSDYLHLLWNWSIRNIKVVWIHGTHKLSFWNWNIFFPQVKSCLWEKKAGLSKVKEVCDFGKQHWEIWNNVIWGYFEKVIQSQWEEHVKEFQLTPIHRKCYSNGKSKVQSFFITATCDQKNVEFDANYC